MRTYTYCYMYYMFLRANIKTNDSDTANVQFIKWCVVWNFRLFAYATFSNHAMDRIHRQFL